MAEPMDRGGSLLPLSIESGDSLCSRGSLDPRRARQPASPERCLNVRDTRFDPWSNRREKAPPAPCRPGQFG